MTKRAIASPFGTLKAVTIPRVDSSGAVSTVRVLRRHRMSVSPMLWETRAALLAYGGGLAKRSARASVVIQLRRMRRFSDGVTSRNKTFRAS
jgi:hypothetical protein